MLNSVVPDLGGARHGLRPPINTELLYIGWLKYITVQLIVHTKFVNLVYDMLPPSDPPSKVGSSLPLDKSSPGTVHV